MNADFAERLGPLQRPDPTSLSEWVQMSKSLLSLAGESKPAISETSTSSQSSANGVTQSGIDPVFLKKGNTVYNRSNGITTKQDGKGGGTLTNEKAIDTFPKVRTYGYLHPIQ